MTSFLGVPIESEGAPVGNFYLTDKAGGAAFTAADERLTELFAAHAGIAIENARLHATAGELAVIRERDRIGRELHDGIIQSLYAVALALEDLPDVMAEAPAEGEVRVDRAIDALQMAIRDIRNFIYGLEPETLDGRDVRAGLAALAEEFRRNTLVDVDAELEEGAASGIGPEHGRDVLQLAREALSNAARHAGARRVTLELRGGPDAWQLTIADDGRGFDPAAVDRRGRRGISNMTARAEIVGASFHLESRPGAGTRIIIAMPAAAPDRPTP
jgi:signal transduction histidine kinase